MVQPHAKAAEPAVENPWVEEALEMHLSLCPD